jgi:hypothetical protein
VWEIELSTQVADWRGSLNQRERDRLAALLELLARKGPVLGRPAVDRIAGSRHHAMKELRVSASGRQLRVLFAFDPRGTAMLLVGGDKTGAFTEWYRRAVPAADDLYDAHLAALRGEGTQP